MSNAQTFIKLAGRPVPVKVIRRNQGGSTLVELLESVGAYRLGDRVNVGTGEVRNVTVPARLPDTAVYRDATGAVHPLLPPNTTIGGSR